MPSSLQRGSLLPEGRAHDSVRRQVMTALKALDRVQRPHPEHTVGVLMEDALHVSDPRTMVAPLQGTGQRRRRGDESEQRQGSAKRYERT